MYSNRGPYICLHWHEGHGVCQQLWVPLGGHILDYWSWAQHIDSITKRAHQHLYLLKSLRRFSMLLNILNQPLQMCSGENSDWVYYSLVRYSNAQVRRRQQKVRDIAWSIMGTKLPWWEFHCSRSHLVCMRNLVLFRERALSGTFCKCVLTILNIRFSEGHTLPWEVSRIPNPTKMWRQYWYQITQWWWWDP